ncbi:glycogenin glucosyltransferase [Exophiala dermatitidis]|uniref:glycogenin glucosyltransferase n=1 Tax=Exophiala dermatitidis (strain ATCC 34100 / CBS 525.76 / NIH/UT8656) TaxID=858893 RepID=H6BZL0_EXODN|nr:glycogenin glucosyltransferase [Exophiala dermatitidis NIH/UT8656]KAJ4514484.1 glycogenin glucosyltransferase [Exophiala dermatitidis]EHY57073.1 glycogenin glucosyltransferase [Exophiala dermatitidis NIH/UT8656]KAJ4523749.1 glycogenin glucosyltransferase [Exophiala dermatitidis]KAJ4578686.1 glycogenin glucosyltransferase [Exophiala dermatitidis]KAJ4600630.1 glycogenin glucosyltransferase [Exophiala dermatitidis]
MAPVGAAVFATLLMNDAYLPGAMVLGHSLKDRGAKAPLVAFVVVDKLSGDTITELRTVYDEIVPVQQIVNQNPANLYLMGRPDLVSTFTKIELWRQTQYKRIVYLDADMVALRAPNELLSLETEFAAVPDIGWPDCFNSGLLVLNPNMADYYALLALAQRGISFDGADQGLLNMHFREWQRLSFVYNCTPSGNYQYEPAYRHFASSIAVVHFIGADKPWTLGRDNRFNTGVYGELLGMWWAEYDKHYRRKTTTRYDTRNYRSKKTVQDYVRGEEPLYVADWSHQGSAAGQGSQPQPSSSHQGQVPLPPEITISHSDSHQTTTMELPLGDAPTPTGRNDFNPTPTVEQRRFSAPQAEWQPTREPPPAHSKPEAANFPTQIYDMSKDTELFQPPARYPDAPKDMWYEVPEKVPEPAKPKPIFPWETRAPKPTRVFPKPKSPSPPPREPSPPVEISAPTPEADATDLTLGSNVASVSPPTDTWTAFQQRTNAWDDMPEIERYVQSLHQARKGKLQVLHHTPSQRSPTGSTVTSPPADSSRRPSIRITDFPTEVERPSLPVTPAPIRRPSFWGEERDEEGNLPAAEGVPKQEDWNPVAKLEELQRRQSEVLLSPGGTRHLEEVQDPPRRKMPESDSIETVIEKTNKAISPTNVPKKPKPILKPPHFELGQEEVRTPTDDDVDPKAGQSPEPVTGPGRESQEAVQKKSAQGSR